MSDDPKIIVVMFSSVPDWFTYEEQTDEMKVYYNQLTGLGMRIVFVDPDLERLEADFVASLEPVPLLMTREEMTPYIEASRENDDVVIAVGLGDPQELDIEELDLLVVDKESKLPEVDMPHYRLKSTGADSWREFLGEMTRTINLVIRKRRYRPSSSLRKDKDVEV